jgi:hypothetical protein
MTPRIENRQAERIPLSRQARTNTPNDGCELGKRVPNDGSRARCNGVLAGLRDDILAVPDLARFPADGKNGRALLSAQ